MKGRVGVGTRGRAGDLSQNTAGKMRLLTRGTNKLIGCYVGRVLWKGMSVFLDQVD
jgi:hypothetical protein